MLFITFGLPGSGKTFVGEILAQKFEFYFHDADIDLPDDMKDSLIKNKIITDDMRDRFFEEVAKSIQVLQANFKHIVVAQTFIKEKYRKKMLKQFPDAKFLFVTTPNGIRESRLLARTAYPIALPYARQMVANFESPQVEHVILDNSLDGEKFICNQLQKILIKEN